MQDEHFNNNIESFENYLRYLLCESGNITRLSVEVGIAYPILMGFKKGKRIRDPEFLPRLAKHYGYEILIRPIEAAQVAA